MFQINQEINNVNENYFRLEHTNYGIAQNSIPDVTIVTPTYNRKNNLRNMLISLIQQTYPFDKFEVIIVDDGSDDGTDTMIKSLVLPFYLKYFWQKHIGRRAGRARNIGVNQARGDIIIFIDSDAYCIKNLVNNHFEKHKKEKKLILLGGIFPLSKGEIINVEQMSRKKINPLRKFIFKMKKRRLMELDRIGRLNLSTFFCSMNVSVRKEHLLAVHSFDEDFDGVWAEEDVELGYRLHLYGLKVDFNIDATVYHQWHVFDLTRPFAIRNRLLLFIKHPELLNHKVICNRKNIYFAYHINDIKSLYEITIKKQIAVKETFMEKTIQKIWVIYYLLILGLILIIKDRLKRIWNS